MTGGGLLQTWGFSTQTGFPNRIIQEIPYENFRLVRNKQPQWLERSVKEAFSDEIAEYESFDIAQSS